MEKLVTYAQNREDLYLFALLGHVVNGFYVDVGAYHESLHSVTKLFYDRGWHGINIDANEGLMSQLSIHRPRDINLAVGVSDVEGLQTFREYPMHDGLSTLNPGIMGIHEGRDLPYVDHEIRVTTLAQIFEEHNVTKIDFLKIDVEGAEVELLRGNNWQRIRPSVVMFEANRGQESIDVLAKQGYRLEFFDGLNHYMVAEEATGVTIQNLPDRILQGGVMTRLEFELLEEVELLRAGAGLPPRSASSAGDLGIRGAGTALAKAIKRRLNGTLKR